MGGIGAGEAFYILLHGAPTRRARLKRGVGSLCSQAIIVATLNRYVTLRRLCSTSSTSCEYYELGRIDREEKRFAMAGQQSGTSILSNVTKAAHRFSAFVQQHHSTSSLLHEDGSMGTVCGMRQLTSNCGPAICSEQMTSWNLALLACPRGKGTTLCVPSRTDMTRAGCSKKGGS